MATKKTKHGPITGWKPGDRVRVMRQYYVLHKCKPALIGTEGVLGDFNRVQDGVEFWNFFVGMELWGIGHTNGEKI